MKQRIVVMNGQRIVQSEQGKDWIITKVRKAGHTQPGVYNISTAVQASRDKTYEGVVLTRIRNMCTSRWASCVFAIQRRIFRKFRRRGATPQSGMMPTRQWRTKLASSRGGGKARMW